jgi:hypothetical protein
MTDLSRRQLGAFFVAGAALAGLSACATSPTVSLSTFETYAQNVVTGIEALASSVSVTSLLTAAQISSLNSYVTAAKTALSQIESAASAVILSSAQGYVSAIQTAVSQAISIINSYVSLPTSVTQIITAIETVMPVLVAAVQLSLVAAKRTGMSLQDAQTILAHPQI